MTTQFPNGIDTFPRPVATDPLSNPAHAALHTNVSDAVVAIQQDIGTTDETDPATVRGALLGKADIGHTHNYAPLVHGHAIEDVTNLRSELDGLRNDIDASPPSPLTTKGDLFGFDTDVARIPVGLPGQILAADPAAAAGVRWRDEVVAPVGGITLNYRFDNAVAAAGLPSGQYRLNNAAPASATQMFVNSLTQPGNDASVIWDSLDIGDFMTLWKTSGGPAASQGFKLTSKPVAAGVAPNKIYTFGIAQVVAPQGTIADNNDVAINTISTPAATLPAGGNQGHVLTKQSGADYDVAWESGRWVLRGGDNGIGPLGFPNNQTIIQTVAGAKLNSGAAGNIASVARPGGNGFTVALSDGTTLVARIGLNDDDVSEFFGTITLWNGDITVGTNPTVTGGIADVQSGAAPNICIYAQAPGGAIRLRPAGRGSSVGQLTVLPSAVTGQKYEARSDAPGWSFQSADQLAVSRGGIWADAPNQIRLVTADFGAGVRLNGPTNTVLIDGNLTANNLFGIGNVNSGDANTFQGALRGGWSGPSGANAPYAFASVMNLPGLGGRDMQLGWFTGSDTSQPESPSFRTFNDSGSWNPWRKFWHSGNLNPVTINTPQTITGPKNFQATTADGNTDLRVSRTVGTGAPNAGAILFGTGNSEALFFDGTRLVVLGGELLVEGLIGPTNDNVFSAARPSFRYSVVYAGTGAINTSDEREKTPLSALTAAELSAAKELASSIGTYKWLAMIAKKGDAARTHVGVTAQQVIAIMATHGLDAMKYGFVCYDQWDSSEEVTLQGETRALAAGDRYGVRYDELLAFIAAGFEARLAALEAAL
jgi:hypothetical protein